MLGSSPARWLALSILASCPIVGVHSFAPHSGIPMSLRKTSNFPKGTTTAKDSPYSSARSRHLLGNLRLQIQVGHHETEDLNRRIHSQMVDFSQHSSLPQDAPALSQNDDGLICARLTVLGVAAMYGTNFGSVKLLQDSMPPSLAAGLRFALAGAALAPMLGKLRKEAVLPSIEIGLLVAAGYFAQGLGLESADASTAAFLCSLAVVVCPLLDALEGKRLGARAWLSAGLAVAGAGVLELGGAKAPCAGDLWALAQPLAFGSAFWKTEQAMRRFPDQALPLTAVQIIVVAVAALLWALVDAGGAIDVGAMQSAVSDWKVAAALVWTGLFTTALTVVLETWALSRLSSAETTVLFSTEPLWGTAFAHLVLGEHVGLNALLGGVLILAACGSSFTGAGDGPEEQPQPPPDQRRDERKGAAGDGRGLKLAVAGSLSWAAVRLEPLQALLASLSDL